MGTLNHPTTQQHDEPGDFVLATGQNHTVRDFVERAFDVAGIKGWEKLVKTDKAHLRPAEVVELLGDASKARKTLGWKPRTTFEDLVRIMVEADMARVEGKKGRR